MNDRLEEIKKQDIFNPDELGQIGVYKEDWDWLISALESARDDLDKGKASLEFWIKRYEDEKVIAERYRDLLELILPLAKGYAAEHRVGSNAKYVTAAEVALEEPPPS